MERVVATGRSPVAGSHVGAEQQYVVVGLGGAQLGDPLGRLPVADAWIVQPGRDEHRRIGLAGDVVVGGVRLHIAVPRCLAWVAPLQPLLGGERDRRVRHRVDHVHEGDVGNHRLEQVGAHVDDRAHEQPAGAASADRQPVALRVALRHQVLGGGDEIGERVLLVEQPPLLVPLTPHLLTAADVGDGVNDAAVEQAHQVRAERRIGADPVGAVRVQQ